MNAITEVLQGRVYLTPAVTKGVIAMISDPSAKAQAQLTPRQREVLKHIAEGRRMKEIASILNLDPDGKRTSTK